MKAKTYAWIFIDNPSSKKAVDVLQTMLEESITLAETRRCKTDEAFQAVFRELDIKWKAFARIVNEHFQEDKIRSDGFMDAVRHVFEDAPQLAQRILPR